MTGVAATRTVKMKFKLRDRWPTILKGQMMPARSAGLSRSRSLLQSGRPTNRNLSLADQYLGIMRRIRGSVNLRGDKMIRTITIEERIELLQEKLREAYKTIADLESRVAAAEWALECKE